MSQITNRPPPPRLVLVDKSDRDLGKSGLPSEIEFKFQPTEFTITGLASSWGSSTGMNRAMPIIQFNHGEQQGFSFGMKMWADHSQVDIQSQLDVLKATVVRDEDLKRPPIWQFIWGQFIDETVVVKTLGDIKVDELRPDGSLRGCNLSIELLVYRTVDVALIAEDRPSDTFFSLTKQGEQWEDIAQREYNDAGYGDLLRRRNPTIMFPGKTVGKIVKLPKLATLRGQEINPDSVPLRRTADALALRLKVYNSRSKVRYTPVLRK